MKDLKILANEIRKIYTTFLDFKNGKYQQPEFDSTKNIHLTLVTLEDWYIYLNPFISKKLDELLIQCFEEEKLDVNLIELYPYTIFSSKDFEREIQVINSIGINEYFQLRYNLEYHELNNIRSKIKYEDVFDVDSQDIFQMPDSMIAW